ncbi:ribonuclease P protein component [Sorangium cellulosum]|uniref:Ribonuclease P protein component n=1 Tax=Sorangium cellulosum TaxID=56 RepID=A0A2L0EQA7_SORCE|nr:ribonuclease P protein component [Sorangium cellulosum]AUX41442.1 ribonuclease P protein component [Sorangium cellulosum]
MANAARPRSPSSPSSSSFPRARRIRKRADFVRIQNGGHRVTTRHLLILVAAPPRTATKGATSAPSSTLREPSRLGLVASRKVGGAVVRNRAKRLLREAYRRFPELFPERVDIVVILRTGAGALGLDDVLAELRSVVPVLRRRARDALAAEGSPSAGPRAPSPPGRGGDSGSEEEPPAGSGGR